MEMLQKKIAKDLLEIEAVFFRPEKPFLFCYNAV